MNEKEGKRRFEEIEQWLKDDFSSEDMEKRLTAMSQYIYKGASIFIGGKNK